MTQYKGYPVYGVAVPAEHCWNARGLIFEGPNADIEIKRIECATDLTFKDKREAEEFALNYAGSGSMSRVPPTDKAEANCQIGNRQE
jgi:hypothetical protein